MYQVKNILCEHVGSPLAVTVQNPRFSWSLCSEKQNIYQDSFRIIVKKEDGSIVWDSEKIQSRKTLDIEYEGQPLESKCRYIYQITVWDREGAGEAWMEVIGAMMRGENPTIISDEEKMRNQGLEPYDPPVRMRREFRLEKQVKRARLFVTAHGIYEVRINGKHVTDSRLNPGFTSYDKRIKYQVFQVEDLLQCGENAVAVTVADGWYKGKIALGRGCEYGEVPGLLLQIEIEYEDGTRTRLCSDKAWHYSFDGPIRMADLFLGQSVDARRDDGDPSLCGYDAHGWRPVLQKPETGKKSSRLSLPITDSVMCESGEATTGRRSSLRPWPSARRIR